MSKRKRPPTCIVPVLRELKRIEEEQRRLAERFGVHCTVESICRFAGCPPKFPQTCSVKVAEDQYERAVMTEMIDGFLVVRREGMTSTELYPADVVYV